MALLDWLWLVRLILEILKGIAEMPAADRLAIAQLRKDSEAFQKPKNRSKTPQASKQPRPVT